MWVSIPPAVMMFPSPAMTSADDHRVFLLRTRIGKNRPNTILNARIPRMADADDQAMLDADIGFDDAQDRIQDRGVGDDEIERVFVEGGRRLSHPVADDLAAAEFHLVAVPATLGNQVALHLDE
jgi:riboflavin biosynthesis pyrimidine reductase